MLRLLNAVNQQRAGSGVFVTLTYPADHPTARASKRDLDTYLKRLGRECPGVSGFWKLEPQKRGAPHYHLLLFFGCRIDESQLAAFREWSAVAWYEVVGSNNPHHLYVTRRADSCTLLRTWAGVYSYAAKYLGKQVDQLPGWSAAGKYWGVHRRKLLPVELVTEDVSPRVANVVRRAARRFAARQLSDRFVVTPHAESVRDKVRRHRGLQPKAIKLFQTLGYSVHQVRRGKLRASGGLTVFLGSADSVRLIQWAKLQATTPTDLPALARSVQRFRPDHRAAHPSVAGVSVDHVRLAACPHLRWSPVDGDQASAWQTDRWAERAAECFG